MSEHDDGLARIDSMLEDYIPPSHLALVPTAEEAEALGYDPHRYDDFDYGWEPRPVTGNTYALARAEVEGRSHRAQQQSNLYMRQQVEARYQRREQEIFAVLRTALAQRIPRLHTLEVSRLMDMYVTQVDAWNDTVRLRYWMSDELLGSQDVLTFKVRKVFVNGQELQVRPELNHLTYHVQDSDPRAFIENRVMRQEVVDLTPFAISAPLLEADYSIGGHIRGRHVSLVILDELEAFTEGMRAVGQAGLEASELLNQFRNQVLEEIPEPEQEVDTRPSAPAPLVRSHLDGQRSPYGPPSRRRAR